MAQLPLRQAARQVGVSRQTVYRMVKEGKLSSTVDATGQKVVDTAELLRVFGRLEPPSDRLTLSRVTVETVAQPEAVLPRETGDATAPQALTGDDRRREYEAADRAALQAELRAAKEALEATERQLGEAKEREAKLLDLLAGQTRLLEHKAEAEAPPARGWLRRMLGV